MESGLQAESKRYSKKSSLFIVGHAETNEGRKLTPTKGDEI